MEIPQKKDIISREDIETLVDSFYKKVIKDDTIGYFFNKIVKLDWEKHIPIMYDFWETTLFHQDVFPYNLEELKHVDSNHSDSIVYSSSSILSSSFAVQKKKKKRRQRRKSL